MEFRQKIWRSASVAALAAFGVMPGASFAVGADDLPQAYVLSDASVYLGGEWASALAVSDGRIVAVGEEAAVKAAVPAGTPVIDLGGKTVFPGFYDMHVHPQMAGSLLSSCMFPQSDGLAAVQAAVKACADKAAPGEWIVGGQWTAAQFAPGEIDRKSLDAVSGDHPVALVDTSGHSQWVNTRALELAGVTAGTPDPEGGIIERDAAGQPTGVLRDNAEMLVEGIIPPPTAEKVRANLKRALDMMVASGITALEDAIVEPGNLKAYMELASEGALVPRVRGCLVYGRGNDKFEGLLAAHDAYRRARFKLDCVKLFMDGVPTESHTGAMIAPYVDVHAAAGAPPRGLLMIPPATVGPLVTRIDAMGMTVKFHAAGDGAVRASIDAVEAARKANGMGGPSHQVGHLTFVDKADFARVVPLDITLEYSPYLWFPQPIVADIEAAVGPERNARAWPVQEGLATNALVIVGSDWPIVPSVNPWIAIETLVTRQMPGAKGGKYGGGEAITLKQAIDLFTVNGARAFTLPGGGRIAVGAPADLIVLDRNPFRIPIGEVHKVKVLETIIEGRKVFDAASGS